MRDMLKSALSVCAAIILSGVATISQSARAEEPTIRLEVDATDLPRNLLRSTMVIQAAPGPLELHFVTWTPGNHAPSGPIQNVVNIELRDCAGALLDWDRDPASPATISTTVPAGCDALRVSMSYIASQPSVTSRSTDTYGRANMGVLNWNTALFYPGGAGANRMTVAASLGLSSQWKYATSLRVREADPDRERFSALESLRPAQPVTWIDFQPVSLAELIDSPVIMGQWLSTRRMHTEGVPGVDRSPAHHYCLVGPDEKSIVVPEWLEAQIDSTIREAIALFAPRGFPRDRFYFLHALGEGLDFGVEHALSTLIGDGPRLFRDARRDKDREGGAIIGVVPHEYFHAWCGKLVAPLGLGRDDYHTPIEPDLLWVYEGLTTYYTSILSVRGGLTNFAEYLEAWAQSAAGYERRAGRLWRSVEDSTRAAGMLRDRGRFWYEFRQGQEYYGQGALFWLEADATIRRGTQGARSLDDFCRALFGDAPANEPGIAATYAREDIVRTLTQVYPEAPWSDMIHERIELPQQSLDLSRLWNLAGYRLVYTEDPAPLQKRAAGDASSVDLRTSLGVRLDKEGEIVDVVPGSPADAAGLGYGMRVLAIDGWVYSADRMREAIKATPDTGKLELTIAFGERVEVRAIEYRGGMRWPRLERIEGEPDIFAAIAKPLIPRAAKSAADADEAERD